MLKTRLCAECDTTKTNCVEIGCDDNYVCLDCLAFILDQNSYFFERKVHQVKQRTEKIDPNNVPF